MMERRKEERKRKKPSSHRKGEGVRKRVQAPLHLLSRFFLAAGKRSKKGGLRRKGEGKRKG